MSSRVSAPAHPHCRNCGARIDPQTARVVGGNNNTVPVCGHGDCADDLAFTGATISSTVRAVKIYHGRKSQ